MPRPTDLGQPSTSLSPTFPPPFASPNPAHAPSSSALKPSRPLLSTRASSGASSSAHPSSGKIPSRYNKCVLCGIVEQTRRELGYRGNRGDKGKGKARAEDGARASADEASSSAMSDTGFEAQMAYPQPGMALRTASTSTISTRHTIQGREVLYHDADITIYPAIGKERLVGNEKHLIVVINQHAESVYDLGPSDIPLLSKIIDESRLLLDPQSSDTDLRIGFIGSVMRDPQSSHAHLHAHAMLGPPDPSLPGASFWRRNVVFGWGNWWSVEDLRAEIREETSNNRVKSGQSRSGAVIDKVPNAGSRPGLPNALDIPPGAQTVDITSPT